VRIAEEVTEMKEEGIRGDMMGFVEWLQLAQVSWF